MFGLFKKKSKLDKLRDKHKKLLKESFELSRTNRAQADKKAQEAETVAQEIEREQQQSR